MWFFEKEGLRMSNARPNPEIFPFGKWAGFNLSAENKRIEKMVSDHIFYWRNLLLGSKAITGRHKINLSPLLLLLGWV